MPFLCSQNITIAKEKMCLLPWKQRVSEAGAGRSKDGMPKEFSRSRQEAGTTED